MGHGFTLRSELQGAPCRELLRPMEGESSRCGMILQARLSAWAHGGKANGASHYSGAMILQWQFRTRLPPNPTHWRAAFNRGRLCLALSGFGEGQAIGAKPRRARRFPRI